MLPYYAYTTEGNEGLEPFFPSLETFSPVRCRMSRTRGNGCKGRCYGNPFQISIRSKREPTPWLETMRQNDNESVARRIEGVTVPAAKELAPYHLEWSRYAILMAVYEQAGRRQDSLVSSRGFAAALVADSVADRDDAGVQCLRLTKTGAALRPEMLRDFGPEEASLAMETLRKISPNASVL